MLKQQEGVASNQVMLRVRFAEVSRSAMQELGASFFANGSGTSDQWFGRTRRRASPAPDFEDGKLVFSDFLNLFVFNAKENLGGVVRALSNKGLFQSLAEPNLIATNGKEASFLAGGEYPYPVVQSGFGHQLGDHHLQGVRRPPQLHADGARWRSHPPQGQARGQLARLRQRGRHRRLPRAGAVDAPHRDGSRAARRADVRDRRA